MRRSLRRLPVLTTGLAGLLAVTLTAPVDAARTGPLSSGSTQDLSAPSAATADRVGSRPFTKRAITIPVKVGPKRDIACTIAADLYRPRGVDRHHKAPAILTTNGFGGAKDDANQSGIGRGFAKERYVVLSYSGLGFGGSGCKIYLDSPAYDGKAGEQLVNALNGTKRVFDAGSGEGFRINFVAHESPGDPRVGMIGGSYGGQIQYAVAKQDPRIDALIPIITWNDLGYSLAPNNTSLRRGVTYGTAGVHKKEWTSFFFAVGITDGVSGATVDPTRNVGCPNFDDRACQAKIQLDAQGFPNSTTRTLSRRASVTSYVKDIRVPTLLVQGQADTLFNLQEAAATYRALRSQGTPTRMIWQSWGHSEGGTPAPGELRLGAKSIRGSLLGRRYLHWMNHYVRGNQSAPVGPRFCYFRDWVHYDRSPAHAGTAVAKAYRCTKRYIGDRLNESLHLSGSSRLVRRTGGITDGSASYANAPGAATSYSETSALEGMAVNNPPSDGTATFAAWTTPRLARTTHIVGMPSLTLHLDAPVASAGQSANPGAHLLLFAKLYDVARDGSVTLQHRLISPVRVANVDQVVQVQLPGVVQQIKAGHRIRLVVAASDLAYAGNTVTQPVTITTSRAHPSVLRLPLTTGPLHFVG
jgi:ABC-2 type transport system ATP-binding protein